jgi:hypothetical protein
MPLSEAVAREHVHTRDILCRGYRREDGLWDIEGRMTDTKTYAFENRSRGTVEPGDPVHDMWLRLTVDDELEIRSVEAVTDKHPFPNCPGIAPDYACMVGTRIRSGWTRLVRERLGKDLGCTHLTRLLQELAVVAAQTVWPLRRKPETHAEPDGAAGRKPPFIDTCHALRSDGPVVREHFPQWFRDRG